MSSEISPRQTFNTTASYRPAVLRALHYAQGQLVHANRPHILYLTSIALELVREETMAGAARAAAVAAVDLRNCLRSSLIFMGRSPYCGLVMVQCPVSIIQ